MKQSRARVLLFIPVLLMAGYFIADHYLNNAIEGREVKTAEFQGKYYSLDSTSNATTLVLIGGGPWGDFWASEVAKRKYIGFSLPYRTDDNLPFLLEEIPLEYFENALTWLAGQPEVNPEKIVVMGASRNAELALMIASEFPNLVSGVIAYSPSSAHWSNSVMPFNSSEIKPSWTYNNTALPYIQMPRLEGSESDTIKTLDYWLSGLSDTAQFKIGAIPVEKINGPILMFSGLDDRVWPSALMSGQITDRLKNHNFQHVITNMKYIGAGHLISGNPSTEAEAQMGKMVIGEKTYLFSFGGNPASDFQAKQDAQNEVYKYLSQL